MDTHDTAAFIRRHVQPRATPQQIAEQVEAGHPLADALAAVRAEAVGRPRSKVTRRAPGRGRTSKRGGILHRLRRGPVKVVNYDSAPPARRPASAPAAPPATAVGTVSPPAATATSMPRPKPRGAQPAATALLSAKLIEAGCPAKTATKPAVIRRVAELVAAGRSIDLAARVVVLECQGHSEGIALAAAAQQVKNRK